MKRNQSGRQITGNFHLNFDDNAEEDEDAEDEEEELWFDYREMMSGTVKHRRIKQRKVTIVEGNGQKHICKGKFPLIHPWWTVMVKMNNGYLKSHPAYSISPHTQSRAHHVMIFLDDCLAKAPVDKRSATKTCFEIFCRQTKDCESLSLSNLKSILSKYIEKEGQECHLVQHSQLNVGNWTAENHGTIIKAFVLLSEMGVTTLLAASHPHLVQTLSQLLPSTFQDFLLELESQRFVSKAAAIAKRLPWEFGFRQIISRKLNIRGVEAYLSAFDIGGFFTTMPELYRDALYIYEVLKVDSRRNGHMYMPFRTLVSYKLFRKLDYTIAKERRWHDALKYLQKNNIIVIEQFDQDDNIFLKYNWLAEIDIRSCVRKISQEYFPMCQDFEFDISCPEFDKVRKDPDQVKALYSAAHFPITVLSGSGGCGKTTVVTTLLKHLCGREEMRLHEKEQEGIKRLHNGPLSSVLSDSALINESSILSGADNSREDESQMPSSEEGTSASAATGTGQNENDKLEADKASCSSQSAMENGDGLSSAKEDLKEDLTEALISDLIKVLKEGKKKDSPEMADFKKQFLLTAPTGKAARLLGCKAALPSATIHSILWSWKPTETEWKYNCVKVLIVDECSLVSVRLFASLLNILTQHASLNKVILLGDIKQLPSIEPGDFLRDIFRSLSLPGLSIELTNNHRSESALIVENAKKISRRKMPAFDPNRQFHFIEIQEDGSDCERDETVRDLLNTRSDLKCHMQSQFVAFLRQNCLAVNELCCKHYNNHSVMKKGLNGKDVYDFRPGDKISLGKNKVVQNETDILLSYIQDHEYFKENYLSLKAENRPSKSQAEGDAKSKRIVLTADEASSLFLGDEAELDKTVTEMEEKTEILKRERMERIKRAAAKSRAWKAQRANEPQRANEVEVSSAPPEPKSSCKALPFKPEEKLCNGEIFFIMDERTVIEEGKKPVKYFILSDRDPQLPNVVCVSETSLRRDCRMKHSWARTIHTYQGSESQNVVFVVGTAIPQNWQHVYTAMTRGKRAVYIASKASQLQIAVGREAERRHSRLYDRLKDLILDISDTFSVFRKNVSLHMARGPEGCLGFHETSIFHKDTDDFLICNIEDPSMADILIEPSQNPETEEHGLVDVANEPRSFHQADAEISHVSSTSLVPSTSHVASDSLIPATSHIPSTSKLPPISHVLPFSHVPSTSHVSATNNDPWSSHHHIPLTSHDPSHIPSTSHFSRSQESPVANSAKKESLSERALLHSPPKIQRPVEESYVDTPFHKSFARSLSIDDSQEKDEENPLDKRKRAVRKNLNLF